MGDLDHIGALESLSDPQRAAVDRQVAAERRAALATIRTRLAIALAAPVGLLAGGSWVWLLHLDAARVGIEPLLIGVLARGVMSGSMLAFLGAVGSAMVYMGVIWFLSGGDR